MVARTILELETFRRSILDGLPGSSTRRTARIIFDHAAGSARVTEHDGRRDIASITVGWIPLDQAEAVAAFYAASRGLPISRVDAL